MNKKNKFELMIFCYWLFFYVLIQIVFKNAAKVGKNEFTAVNMLCPL